MHMPFLKSAVEIAMLAFPFKPPGAPLAPDLVPNRYSITFSCVDFVKTSNPSAATTPKSSNRIPNSPAQ